MKVVINKCFGGFGLSKAAFNRYNELSPEKAVYQFDIKRNDPFLIQAIEEIGVNASGLDYSELKIVDIPSDVSWYVDDYDGMETIRESHRTWD
jgi:hypothetical protein